MKLFTSALGIFLVIAIVANSALGIYLFNEVRRLQQTPEPEAGTYVIKDNPEDLSGYATISYVNELLGKPTPKPVVASTPSPTPVATSNPTATTQKTEVSYLPIGGSLTTTSTDWTDVPGSDFWADFSTDFGSNAQISWEVTLKVEAGSGRVTARLMDTTHGIELLESQVFTESGAFASVASGRIYPWAGKNLYRVQIRSLIPTSASFVGGRVKVVY